MTFPGAPALKQEHDHWLDQQLHARQRTCRHAVVFQHIPLFRGSIDEDDDYFNLTKALRKEMADTSSWRQVGPGLRGGGGEGAGEGRGGGRGGGAGGKGGESLVWRRGGSRSFSRPRGREGGALD